MFQMSEQSENLANILKNVRKVDWLECVERNKEMVKMERRDKVLMMITDSEGTRLCMEVNEARLFDTGMDNAGQHS